MLDAVTRRWLVLWCVLVALGTLHPFVLDPRPVVVPSDSFFVPRFKGLDPPFNVLMFVPLGALLSRLGLRTAAAALVGLLVSGLIELSQHFVAFRVPVFEDLVFNTVGAALGARGVHVVERVGRFVERYLRLPIFVVTTGIVVWSAAPPRVDARLWYWADYAELIVGREQPGNYAYAGEVHAARLFAGAHAPDALPEPMWSSGVDEERRFPAIAKRIEAAGAFTIDVDFDPAPRDDLLRRIFTYSTGVQRRNFLFGAHGDELVFRVRTRVTPIVGLFTNLEEPLTLPRPNERARVTIAYDVGVVRAWVDGAPATTKHFTLPEHNGVRTFWLPRDTFGVWLYWFSAGLVVAAGAAFLRRRWAIAIALAIGVALEIAQVVMFDRAPELIAVVPLVAGAMLGAWSARSRATADP